MKLYVLGDDIYTDGGDLVATFSLRLPATIRGKAEELLMRGAVESDWELRERCYQQQDQLDAAVDKYRDLEHAYAALEDKLRERDMVIDQLMEQLMGLATC